MDFIPLVAALAFASKLLDFCKFLRSKDWNAAFTQAAAWVSGVVAIAILGASTWAQSVVVGGTALGSMNWANLVLVGVSTGSFGSLAYDFKRAFDNTDSAKMPPLMK